MATYVYETIPAKPGGKARTFEIRQSMKDAPLTRHPETGEPVRRVISGGYGVMTPGSSKSAQARGGGHSCATGCGCGH